jgi:hypothetical protein
LSFIKIYLTYEQRRIASKIGESQRREQRYGGLP